jgi:hypothetical protein
MTKARNIRQGFVETFVDAGRTRESVESVTSEVTVKLRLFLAGAVLGLALCGTAKAQALTGSQLQEACKAVTDDNTPPIRLGTCLGFVRGVVDTQAMWEVVAQVDKSYPKVHSCVPKEVEMKQTVQVVLKFLDDHPERLHEPAVILVLEALHNAFPCSAKPSKP